MVISAIILYFPANILPITYLAKFGNEKSDTILSGIIFFILSDSWERPFEPAQKLYIDFRRFDGELGGSVILQAMWWIIQTADDKRLITNQSSIVIPTLDDSFEAYVAAQNTALEKLSIEIAESYINALP